MQFDNTIESTRVNGEDQQAQRHQFRDSFEAALRVNKHHARKFETRLHAMQQQSRAEQPGREGE